MSDFILIDGDTVLFLPSFPPAIVIPLPANLKGSGKNNVNGQVVCIEGDEKKIEVKGCMYMAAPYVIPGVGTLKIASLATDQKAVKTKSGHKVVLLKGKSFEASFEVQTAAQMPPPSSTPDPNPSYSGGKGMFMPKNLTVKGT